MTASPLTHTLRGLSKFQADQIARLIKYTACEGGIHPEQIIGPCQAPLHVRYRRAIMYVMRVGYGMTLEKVARCFRGPGNKPMHHASVCLAVEKVKELEAADYYEGKGWKILAESGQLLPADVDQIEALRIAIDKHNRMNPPIQIEKTWTR